MTVPPKIIGKARSLQFFATARPVSGQKALEIGLVTQIHDPVVESALALAVTVPKKKGAEQKPGTSLHLKSPSLRK